MHNHKTLDDWFSHITQLHKTRVNIDLNRIAPIAARLNINTFTCPVITIAGTNGKGSTAKTLESIYTEAGFSVALFTSPHLMHFNERIRINNQNIDDADLLRAFAIIDNAREVVVLSFFEFITLAALYLFQQANCDVVILEVGVGGRLDAVNIVENDVAVITSIDLDHMDLLGTTRELIGYEKACIARAGKVVVCGDSDPPLSIAKTVSEKGGKLSQINRDFFYRITDGHFSCWGKRFRYDQLPLPHLKLQNTAIAIAVINALQKKLNVSAKAIAAGIQKTNWPGRFEIIRSPMSCVFDVAHNPSAARWLAQQYQQLPIVQNTIAIVGMLKDKAMVETVRALLPCVDTWYVCSLMDENKDRGSDGVVISHFLQESGTKNVYTFASVSDAMYSLVSTYCEPERDRALIFGSFYTVAAAKAWLEKS